MEQVDLFMFNSIPKKRKENHFITALIPEEWEGTVFTGVRLPTRGRGGRVPSLDGGWVPSLDRGWGYLPWTGVPTLDGDTYLEWGGGYLPWTMGCLPWMGYLLCMAGTYLGLG